MAALKTFCDSIEESSTHQGDIVELELICSKVNISINGQVFDAVRVSHQGLAEQLAAIRETIIQPGARKIGVIFLAGQDDLAYVKTMCSIMKAASEMDKNKLPEEYPFHTFSKKSPNGRQLHQDNVTHPDELQPLLKDYPNIVLPIVDSWDTKGEQLVAMGMGTIYEHQADIDASYRPEKLNFEDHAIKLPDHAESFLLFLKSPSQDTVYCTSRKRVKCAESPFPVYDESYLPTVELPEASLARIAHVSCAIPQIEAQHIARSSVPLISLTPARTKFKAEYLSFLKDLNSFNATRTSPPPLLPTALLYVRLKKIVKDWRIPRACSCGLTMANPESTSSSFEDFEDTKDWKAERISLPSWEHLEGWSAYYVTLLPLVPKEEGSPMPDGTRPVIEGGRCFF
ncbi:hypothetical protein QBC47DRAFT_404768 [Echria macrotheca]|uniref:Uncharacterized protein n=1 Tax=Echria macrotheca TaxID=438768 RepID=A0AAJ0BAM9_9PEZI|nr:hypothetical protein QBC47DRAFT_404768 [Echria macrotheca]